MRPETIRRFRDLHVPHDPLLMPNAWDLGSARLLAELGFAAVATTSAGLSASLGRTDGRVTRDESLSHAAALAASVDIPVSADLEDGYGPEPAEAAATIAAAVEAGLAGASIEDYDPRTGALYDLGHARERVAAAAEAAHQGPAPLVLTARAENFFRGPADLDDAITRLRAYQEAGADVLYAPGLTDAADIGRLVASVDRPVTMVLLPGVPTVPELAELGVARISTAAALTRTAYDAARVAALAVRETGAYPFPG